MSESKEKPASTSSSAPDWLSKRMLLRADIHCTLQASAGKSYYQLEDPLSGRFYRLGLREWKLAGLFDGQRTLGEILATLPAESQPDRLGQQDAVAVFRWLLQTQLIVPARAAQSLARVASNRTKHGPPWWTNPLFIRIPVVNPDRWLERCLPYLTWTISPPAIVGWFVFLLCGIYHVALDWDRFATPIATIFAPDNWLHLLLVWVGLKIIHEFYHGLICRKFGGHVASCGLMLILFSPVAYVDVTSSWRFRSKWHRIFTSAGGMYAEFFVASCAAIWWSRTDSPLVAQLCHNVVTMASFTTLLFNGNFLMKYDGYYIFSDLIEIQNLYTTGQQYIRYLVRRYLFNVPAASPVDRSLRDWLVRSYAVASFGWRLLFYGGILFTAAALFHGAGIIIAVFVGASWFFGPLATFARYVIWGSGNERPNRLRFAAIVGTACATLGTVLYLPWPGGIVATGIVEYEPLEVIRAEDPGFVREISVMPGQDVVAGQTLVTLENKQTQTQLHDLDVVIEQALFRSRMLQSSGESAQAQIEVKRLASLERQRDELRQRHARLTVQAPVPGRVIGGELEMLRDQFLSSGSTILALGQEDRKAIHVAVAQQDADQFVRHVGQSPRVRIRGRSHAIRDARLERLQPRASRQLFHPALAAPLGGPLAVVPRAEGASEGGFELVEPHFQAIVSLPSDIARKLRAGELARVRLQTVGETVGQHLWQTVQRWVGKKLGSE